MTSGAAPARELTGPRRRAVRVLPDPGTLRTLAAATLVITFGTGLFLAGSALFLTRSVGLSVAQVGLGLTVAGLVGLLAGIPLGHLADRCGARQVLVALLVAQALAVAAYVLVSSFAAFLVVASLVAAMDQGATAVRSALIATTLAPAARVRGRAYLRSVTNVGLGLGAAAATVALHVDTRAAYLCLVVGNAVTSLLAAPLVARLPRGRPLPRSCAGPALVALRDRPYLLVTAVHAVMSLHYGLLEVGLPLWIAGHTAAPRWLVGVILLVNTVMVVLFQVRASCGTEDVVGAARAVRSSGGVLAAACLLFAAAAHGSVALATGLLLAGALVHAVGEIRQAAGGWGLGFGLADDRAPGQYQAVFSSGVSVSLMLAPAVMTVAVIGWGIPGWLLLAATFLSCGLVTVSCARWALRCRTFRPVPT